MPELPEVDTVVRVLKQQGLIGRRICGCRLQWERTVGGDREAFLGAIAGALIRGAGRRGKYIVLPLLLRPPASTDAVPTVPAVLLVHLRMSGRLYISNAEDPPSGYERVVFVLDDGRLLRFHDPRKFGRVLLLDTPPAKLRALGPEPNRPGFSSAVFGEALRARRRILKALLLDQTVLAGLGNIYVDEALWEAGLHPQRLGTSLEPSETERLSAAIQTVLGRAIANNGTRLGDGTANFVLPSGDGERARHQNHLRVFRRTGLPCERCGTAIARIVVAQRSTHICPSCQMRADAPGNAFRPA